MNKKIVFVGIILGIAIIAWGILLSAANSVVEVKSIDVNLSDLTYKEKSSYIDLKVYTQDDYEEFLSDYNSSKLPDIYVTEFVFDGAGMYKTYDLDDFIDEGNDVKVKTFKTTALNINASGEYVLSGDLKGTLLVNTNNLDGDVKISLNGVNIDSDSKKIPAVYVYNKDISYTDHKVTISTLDGTKNYITGGKFKKVSLIGSDELSNFSRKYSGEASTWYSTYTNYYGVYTSDEIKNILFAMVTADSEDLQDGDPYYFYKGAGAISSDIDLYFEGKGYLEVSSLGKEGIETKGNLTLSGGTGDYVVYAYDDCLNTTTKKTVENAHNEMYINVNSLTAVVDLDADEGDALDSNGSLTIDGGTIVAIAKPGSDAGLDSESGTYINGGTVLATGDMYDQILSDSKQSFMALSFSDRIVADDVISFVDSNNNVIFAYKTDRTYSTLVYSSSKLVDGDYSLYKDSVVSGENVNGFYNTVDSFTEGGLLGYTGTGMMGGQGMPGDMQGMTPPDGQEMPNDMQGMTPPEKPDGDQGIAPERPDGNQGMAPGEMTRPEGAEMVIPGNFGTISRVFSISGVSNLFSGIMAYGVD